MPKNDHHTQFLQFALNCGVLKFGSFVTKAGRTSPYFFNAGLFNTGGKLHALSQFYAQTIIAAQSQGFVFDVLFGPAYKGITLAAATAAAMAADHRQDIPFVYNRKEAKDHGEGGTLVGAPLAGRVLIIDDVISAGTSVRESVNLIRAAGATPAGVLIALDRMERGGTADAPTALSAVQEVAALYDIPVFAIANLSDLLGWLDTTDNVEVKTHAAAVQAYRAKFGV